MTLYTAKRSLRKVTDAGYDLSSPNAENVDGNEQIGFTTRLVQHYQSNNPGADFIQVYVGAVQVFEDSGGNIPHQSGQTLILVGPFPGTPGCQGFTIVTNVGLKHYHQELQAMKGYAYSGVNLGNTVNNPNVPANTGVTEVYDGNGTYKTTNISLGNMRGFRYSEDNVNSIWPSTGNPPNGIGERLQNAGSISIGSAV